MFQLKSNRPWIRLSALFGIGMALLLTPLQVAKADPIAYEVTTDVTTPFSQFGTVDLATGAFKQTSVLGFVPTGISRIGSSLYTSTFTGTAFGQINPVTGAVTTISNTGLGGGEYLAMGSTLTTIYALDGSFNLYTVNPLTGAATLIGPTGLVLGLAYQLSTGSSALYFGDNNEIYSLNTSTGAPTAIGSTLLPVGGIDGLVFEHGGLYGGYYNRRLPSWFNLFDRSRDRRGNIHRDASRGHGVGVRFGSCTHSGAEQSCTVGLGCTGSSSSAAASSCAGSRTPEFPARWFKADRAFFLSRHPVPV